MRVVFMGTPDFAVPILMGLVDSDHCVAGVFCQPDRVAGRGKKVRACSVKVKAEALGIPVFQPERIRDKSDWQETLKPECVVVAAYGQILPEWLLELPVFGCVNVHASLLPAYRGAAPIHRAVMNGDDVTGISIMRMDKGLDTGDVLEAESVRIGPEATTGEVHDELAAVGARLLLKTLESLADGTAISWPQPANATYAAKLGPADEVIRWERPAVEIHNQVRGLNPWPGAWTSFEGEKIKVWRSRLVDRAFVEKTESVAEAGLGSEVRSGAGCIVGISARGLLCKTNDVDLTGKAGLPGEGDYLEILEVQPAGRVRMSGRAFFNGKKGILGKRFE
ncbi:MAG: methionyl-tRNA formyltransferase [Peptococcaceae bacterium]|nr:methionyl-tRNA formyltransferase [Peptococcaceae bacterium]